MYKNNFHGKNLFHATTLPRRNGHFWAGNEERADVQRRGVIDRLRQGTASDVRRCS